MFLSKPIVYLNALFISILENKQIYIYTKKIWDGIIDHVSTVSHRCKLFFLGGSQTQTLQPITHFLRCIIYPLHIIIQHAITHCSKR